MRRTGIEGIGGEVRESDVNGLFFCFLLFRHSWVLFWFFIILQQPSPFLLVTLISEPLIYSKKLGMVGYSPFKIFFFSEKGYKKKALFNTKILMMELRHLIGKFDFFLKR